MPLRLPICVNGGLGCVVCFCDVEPALRRMSNGVPCRLPMPLCLGMKFALPKQAACVRSSFSSSFLSPGKTERPTRPSMATTRREAGVVQDYDQRKLWGIILADDGGDVRELLQQRCGGRDLKQFHPPVGRRSLLAHTLARVEQVIPRERILVVVSPYRRAEAAPLVADWPAKNILWQPANRDTAPGILFPLAHLAHRAPFATVAVFPAAHCLRDEAPFLRCVRQAVAETQRFPREVTFVGVTPDRVEEGYGWIEPAAAEGGRESRAVQKFWNNPGREEALALLRRGAVWHTGVFTAQAATVWEMTRQAAPELYADFMQIRRAVAKPHGALMMETIYRALRAVNFAADICAPLSGRLRVLRAPAVGWNDGSSQDRLLESLRQLGKLDERGASLGSRRTIVTQ